MKNNTTFTLPPLVANNDPSEVLDSIEMFSGGVQEKPKSNLLNGLRRDAARMIVREFDLHFDDIMIVPEKCSDCTHYVKCSDHFREGREGFIPEAFDTMFLGQFRTNS